MTGDLAAFARLVDERFDAWVDELRDFCTIPSETAPLPERYQTLARAMTGRLPTLAVGAATGAVGTLSDAALPKSCGPLVQVFA